MKRDQGRDPVLLAMLKAPRSGLVKTRLAREVGAAAAAVVYRRLVEHQLSLLPPGWPIEVHYTPDDAAMEVTAWLGSRHSFYPQRGDDLGERLTHAIAGAFARDSEKVLVIGGDCPDLDGPTLRQASDALETADIVLGPSLDGGYYLIGLKRPAPDLFRGIAWGSSSVLSLTLARVREAGLSHTCLTPKEDVDDLASWRRLEHLCTRAASPGGGERVIE